MLICKESVQIYSFSEANIMSTTEQNYATTIKNRDLFKHCIKISLSPGPHVHHKENIFV